MNKMHALYLCKIGVNSNLDATKNPNCFMNGNLDAVVGKWPMLLQVCTL
jgi:hypothetical protein